MSRGNPNQYRLMLKIRDLGYRVWIKYNQIHIEGVTSSPFYPEDIQEPTYGMTIIEAEEWLKLQNVRNGVEKAKTEGIN